MPDDQYRSARALVHILTDLVSKGGNLLLNIGPGPDGRWHDAACDRLRELGAWLRVNGEAIYGTRSMTPHASGRMRFTRGKGDVVYAIYLAEDDAPGPPRVVEVHGVRPAAGATVTLRGSPQASIAWEAAGDGFVLHVPPGSRPPATHAWAFRIPSLAR